MAYIYFEALERIIPTHVLNTFYNIDFECSVLNGYIESDRDMPKSESGVQEVIVNSDEDFFRLTITNVDDTDLPLWEEFFMSMRAGNDFVFDPYGTSAVPVSAGSYTLVTSKFKPIRAAFKNFDIPFVFRRTI